MQIEAWTKEAHLKKLASTTKKEPSHGVVEFVKRIQPELEETPVIEFGCGYGRNLVYLIP